MRLDDIFEKIRITPRMRGKPVVKNASSRDSGITPADAGKTALTLGTDPEV